MKCNFKSITRSLIGTIRISKLRIRGVVGVIICDVRHAAEVITVIEECFFTCRVVRDVSRNRPADRRDRSVIPRDQGGGMGEIEDAGTESKSGGRNFPSVMFITV